MKWTRVLALILAGFYLYGCGGPETKVLEKSNQASKTKGTTVSLELMVESLEAVRQQRPEEYFRIIQTLALKVQAEIKNNPREWQDFLVSMMEVAIKNDVGLAISIEDYATSRVKEEMSRLRKESDVVNLSEKEKQLAALTAENLKLRKKNSKFQKVLEEKNSLSTLTAGLQKELSQLKAGQEEKDKEIEKLKVQVGLPTEEGVPVLLVNNWHYGMAGIKFINKATGRFWLFYISADPTTGDKERKEVKLSPGDYKVECYFEGRLWATREKVVTKEPSTSYRDKWYHCTVITNSSSFE